MSPRYRRWLSIAGAAAVLLSLFGLAGSAAISAEADVPNSRATAAEVDRLILVELQKAGVEPAGRTNDEDFLRRASLDLAGRLPTPTQTTSFGVDVDPAKRSNAIDRLLKSNEQRTGPATGAT